MDFIDSTLQNRVNIDFTIVLEYLQSADCGIRSAYGYPIPQSVSDSKDIR
jgi:hypothetical protein